MTQTDNKRLKRRDERFMGMALYMARRGLGTTMPNPSVGAVLVRDDGVILSRGCTQPGGRPHAEAVALQKAGEAARGATLYVTLEPCSHFGKSPPCADAVVKAGVRRVVVGVLDPDPRVAGRGVERLRAAGVEVVEDVLGEQARFLTLGHILRVRDGRPFAQLKMAVSADGLVAPGEGAPVWVTGERARLRGHLLRAQADAILIGSGTALADDPGLDCRLPGLEGRSPIRVVLDTHLRLSPDSALLRTAKTVAPVWIMHASPDKKQAMQVLTDAGAELIALAPDAKGRGEAGLDIGLDIGLALAALAGRGVTRLLVEGGPHVWRSFLDAGAVDELVLFQGRGELGENGRKPFVDAGLERLGASSGLEEVDRRAVGEDKMTVYRIACGYGHSGC